MRRERFFFLTTTCERSQHASRHVRQPWFIPGLLTSGFLWSWWRGKRSLIPGTCAAHNFTYMVRCPQPRDHSEYKLLDNRHLAIINCGIDGAVHRGVGWKVCDFITGVNVSVHIHMYICVEVQMHLSIFMCQMGGNNYHRKYSYCNSRLQRNVYICTLNHAMRVSVPHWVYLREIIASLSWVV